MTTRPGITGVSNVFNSWSPMRSADRGLAPLLAGACAALAACVTTSVTACARTPAADTASAATGGPAAPRWDAPTSLTADSGGAAAAFAVAPNAGPNAGRVTAAWVAAPARGAEGRLVIRPDLALPRVAEVRDPASGLTAYGETPPKLAYGPDGTLYAAYLVTKAVVGHTWPVNALRLASSRDGGAHWDAPRTVQSDSANGGSTSDHALHVASDGTLYLTWLAMTGKDSHTYVARSADRGLTWSAPAAIDRGPSCPCCRTAVTSGPDGALYAAWRKIFPAPADGEGLPHGPPQVRDVVVARSGDGGRTWGAPVRVHADAWRVDYCPDAGPSVRAGADGTVHVAWWTGKEGAAGVQYARSHDGGRTWGPPVPLGVGPHSRAAHVQLAVAGAGDTAAVVAAWEDGTRAVAPVVVRVSRDGGRTFAPAEPLSVPGDQVGYPVVALQGGRVQVAWQQRSTAGASHDSAVHASFVAAAKAGPHAAHDGRAAPAAAGPWIAPVGARQVITRAGTLGPRPDTTARVAAR